MPAPILALLLPISVSSIALAKASSSLKGTSIFAPLLPLKAFGVLEVKSWWCHAFLRRRDVQYSVVLSKLLMEWTGGWLLWAIVTKTARNFHSLLALSTEDSSHVRERRGFLKVWLPRCTRRHGKTPRREPARTHLLFDKGGVTQLALVKTGGFA